MQAARCESFVVPVGRTVGSSLGSVNDDAMRIAQFASFFLPRRKADRAFLFGVGGCHQLVDGFKYCFELDVVILFKRGRTNIIPTPATRSTLDNPGIVHQH